MHFTVEKVIPLNPKKINLQFLHVLKKGYKNSNGNFSGCKHQHKKQSNDKKITTKSFDNLYGTYDYPI